MTVQRFEDFELPAVTPGPSRLTKNRRQNDHYGAAPESWATRELLARIDHRPRDAFLDPCAGQGNIASQIASAGLYVRTNDIDPRMPAQTHYDGFNADLYDPAPDWIVTNPPFDKAPLLVPIWCRAARRGVAALLRITFLEPVENRRLFLDAHPPDAEFVLPRMSFTGDGKTDSVTCAWLIWQITGNAPIPAIQILSPKNLNIRLDVDPARPPLMLPAPMPRGYA